jgi:hypothetical protein
MKDGGDEMTIAMILDLPGATDAQYATARGMRRAAPHSGNQTHVAGPTANCWRLVEVWESPKAMGAFFQSAAPLVAETADGDPTWEDAEWQ